MSDFNYGDLLVNAFTKQDNSPGIIQQIYQYFLTLPAIVKIYLLYGNQSDGFTNTSILNYPVASDVTVTRTCIVNLTKGFIQSRRASLKKRQNINLMLLYIEGKRGRTDHSGVLLNTHNTNGIVNEYSISQ